MSSRRRSNSTPELSVLDSAEVFVLIDNVSDGLSSVPDGVSNEMDNIMEAGAECFSGESLCFACFGISLVVTGQLRVRPTPFYSMLAPMAGPGT